MDSRSTVPGRPRRPRARRPDARGPCSMRAQARPTPVDGPEPPGPMAPPIMGGFEQALKNTLATGQPTVVVITSRANPQSHRLWENLIAMPRTRVFAGAPRSSSS